MWNDPDPAQIILHAFLKKKMHAGLASRRARRSREFEASPWQKNSKRSTNLRVCLVHKKVGDFGMVVYFVVI